MTSFHATKMLNTAEGGGVFTLDKEIDEKLAVSVSSVSRTMLTLLMMVNGKMTEAHAVLVLLT